MMQLVLTVLAIGLAALLAVGGINYFSTDIGVRVEVAQGLRAQHDVMTAALTNYRLANNGYIPMSVESLTGFLPDGKVPAFPKTPAAFTWSISKDSAGSRYWLCLRAGPKVLPAEPVVPSRVARDGVASFVRDRAAKFPGTVFYGENKGGVGVHGCGLDATAVSVDSSGTAFDADDISAKTMISIEGI